MSSRIPKVVEIHVIGPPGPPGQSSEGYVFRLSLADDASQTFVIPVIAAGALVRVETFSTGSTSFDWFADMLVNGATATVAVELGIVSNVTVQLAVAIGVSDPDGSLNLALNVPGQLTVRNRTGASAQGLVRLTA